MHYMYFPYPIHIVVWSTLPNTY